MGTKSQLEVGGRKLDVSNLEKVFYPKTGFTKGQVIDYYIQISPFLLPHLKDRPISLKRYPDGVEGFFFYEKQCPPSRPKWMKTANVPRKDGSEINYCVMNDLPALVWAANMADLELHTFLHRAPQIETPTALAFDLDPGAPADIVLCGKVGLWLKELFAKLKLECFPKTSGSKGLQVFVPLNTRVTYEQTKTFAHAVAETLEREFPETVVFKMQKNLRGGKVLVDWSQNDPHKTTVCVYSLRAKEHPTVSTPVTWDEVATAFKKKNAKLLTFEVGDVLKRVKKHGDLFAPVLKLKQKLPAIKSGLSI
jgi:bifunctional non-homologous end joining protein LigD